MGDEVWQWFALIGGPLVAAVWAVWWKIEARNQRDHEGIRKEIAKVRDKIEDIWKHLVSHKD
jgi:hypothetical protein